MSTVAKDIKTMNEVFDVPSSTLDQPNWALIKKQRDMMFSEFNEPGGLDDSIANQDLEGVVDAVADILVFGNGFAHILNMDLDKLMAKVFESNMSKVCDTEEVRDATLAKYRDMGLEVHYIEISQGFVVKSSKEQEHEKLGHVPEGKFLKAVNYLPLEIDLAELKL